jgi:glutathione synthase/RimK-type ligase-like ATP-grasp enzyme
VLNAPAFAEMKASYLREQAYQAAVYSFFETFASRGGLVINPLTSAYVDHESKSQFYEKLRAHGFDVPLGVTTNDHDSALSFISERDGVVIKPACGIGSTRVVGSRESEGFSSLRLCPVLLQERIVGDTIRVHIVGDTVVLALRINADGGVDSRSRTAGFEFFRLPEAEAERIVSANRLLGLHYAAWDIIAAADGRYVYLDCNPGPYVMWIGPAYRRAVFEQLAAYMVAFATTGCLSEAAGRIRPCPARAA